MSEPHLRYSGQARRRAARRRARRRRLAVLVGLVILAGAATVAIAVGTGSSGRARSAGPAAASGPDSAADRSGSAHGRSGPAHPGAATGTVPSGSNARPGTDAYRVGITSLTLSEPATASTATGHSASGAPIRLLHTVVRYPATGAPGAGAHRGAAPDLGAAPFPLVVFSQGFDISAEAYSWLLDAWARAGYVVADPTYPLTDPGTGTVDEEDIVNHPADLRYTVMSLVASGHQPHSVLHGMIAAARVGIVGHSDGGDVTLAVAADSCCRDHPVKAAVILSGAELAALGGRYYSAGSVPLLVVQGSADTINPPGCSAQLYDQAPPPKYYLNIFGAEHQPPYLEPGAIRSGVARTVIAFLNAYLRQRPAHLNSLVHHGTITPGARLTTASSVPQGTGASCPGAP